MASRIGDKAGRFPQAQSAQCAIELNRFQKPEPMGGERGQAFETITRLALIERHAQIVRGNRARSAASSSVGDRGEVLCSIGTTLG